MAAARSSAPVACSVEAVDARRAAALASSAALAIWRAPVADLGSSRQDLLGALQDRRVGTLQRCGLAAHLLESAEHRAVVLDLELDGIDDLLEVAPQRGDLLEDAANGLLDLVGALRGFACEASNVVRHHRETAPGSPGARRLDRAAHRQHGGLHHHERDRVHDLLDVAADRFEPADRGEAAARVVSRLVETPLTSFATAAELFFRSAAILVIRSLPCVAFCCACRALLSICAQRGRGLLRRCSLLLGAAIDLAERRHDLARGARQLLDGRRQLLGRGADLFGRRDVHLAGPRRLCRARQLLGGSSALFERLGLLADRRLRFICRARLFLRGAGNEDCAFFGFAGGPVGFQRRGQRLPGCPRRSSACRCAAHRARQPQPCRPSTR